MKLGLGLTIEQTQKLMMTPELIQAIQILQLNSMELTDLVQTEILQNPILEIDDSAPEYKPTEQSETEQIDYRKEAEERDQANKIREKILEDEYEDLSYKQWEYDPDAEENSYENYTCEVETLQKHIIRQLAYSGFDEKKLRIAKYIIENIDDNGYLTISTDDISIKFHISTGEAEDILDDIQQFDPVGVGSRSLEECLMVQLRSKGLLEPSIQYVVMHNLNDIGNNKISKICKETGLSTEKIQEIIGLIRSLDPKPGSKFASDQSIKYIVPDVIVEKVGQEYRITSNDGIVPHLIINKYYVGLAKENKDDAELTKYINDKYDKAMWLIKSIEQRKHTIYNVVSSVVTQQMDFFEMGPKHLKTMTLKDVAEDIGVHESTVSRAINGKYVQTPRGIFEIKYFFTSGVKANGDDMSSNSVKTFIKEIIDSEDEKNPFSDQYISEELNKRGINISRRTVAKYREGMGILSSAKRKRY